MEELISRLARELRTAIEAELAPLGVTAQQGALILHVARGTSSPSQCAGPLGTDTAGMTRLLDRLEEKGLIRRGRRPGDRRAVVIELTDGGQALHPRVAPVFDQVSARLTAGFTPAERATISDLLQRMIDNLHRID